MFVLGHLGVGSGMLGPLRKRLPTPWLFAGCLLPDLIDKPLFYGLLLFDHGRMIAPVNGSRSFGHTLLFLLVLTIAALVTRKPAVRALAAGVATHLALDIGGEVFSGAEPESSVWLAVLWPFLGMPFPMANYLDPMEHMRVTAASLYNWIGELAGGAILLVRWRRSRRKPQLS